MKTIRIYLGTRWVAVCWTIFILILISIPGNVLPSEEKFAVPNADKLVHSFLFGIFVWLWCLYYYRVGIRGRKLARIFFIFFLISIAYGIGTELIQKYFIPMREYDQSDIIADIIGAGIAYGICNIRLLNN